MYCQNCGNQLREDAKFCPKCGAAVYPASGRESNTQQTQRTQTEQKASPNAGQQATSQGSDSKSKVGQVFSRMCEKAKKTVCPPYVREDALEFAAAGLAIAGFIVALCSFSAFFVYYVLVLAIIACALAVAGIVLAGLQIRRDRLISFFSIAALVFGIIAVIICIREFVLVIQWFRWVGFYY
ncbi:MAG: zinc ribbon domain-containing protein [Lachnospiraceae bacterium]|nr:zinc ribbon domain-containing protein [Lachnospiraceae bacterium]